VEVQGAAAEKIGGGNNARTYFIRPGNILDVRVRDFFNRVFEFPSSKNAQKRNKTNRQGHVGGKKMTHDPVKHFCHVFEFPLPRGA
jgi:hypothetical protein